MVGAGNRDGLAALPVRRRSVFRGAQRNPGCGEPTLRQQLIVVRRQVKRPRWRGFDRCLFATLAGRFHCFLDVVLLVKPETVIRWHRAAWRLLWRSRRPSRRPPIDPDLRELVRQMWRDNPTWGQKIISAELAKLGYQIALRTVAKYRPSGLDRQRGQRWATFIRNHLHETWGRAISSSS